MPRRPRRILRPLLATLFGLPLVLLGLAAALIWWTLPASEESPRLPGLSAPVSITLDDAGIPRIAAQNEADAAMALGWLHARDRMFQMEAMRRGASGRLAELAGQPALRLDRFMRLLGLEPRAVADLAALPPETRAILDAYAAGVNARIAQKGRFIAPEFLVLGPPEPWRAVDSLLWGKIMGLWLSGNWRTEIERAALADALPPERLAELWPNDGSPGRADQRAALPADPLRALLAALPRFPEDAPLPPSASNAWAVGPARSLSGGALLASDPHLGFSAPILWYLARIELPDGRFRAGATSPGVPAIVIGRNERLAWGFTTTHSDTQDVFLEREAGPGMYQTEDGPRAFVVRQETIRVRFGEPEVMTVRETRNGPVISDLGGMFGAEGTRNARSTAFPEGTVLAVAMANLQPGDGAATGLLMINRAQNLAEARAAVARITSPPQNILVAEAAGGVAMYLSGRTPIRRAGDGSLPAPGWDGSHAWTGFVPFDDLPHVEAPESGVVVNANNRVQPPDHAVFLGRDWWGDWRFRRIWELLEQRPRHAALDFARMQNDATSVFARESLAILLAMPRPMGTAGAARDLLAAWDGTAAVDRPQPLIFHAWADEMGEMALRAGGVPVGGWNPSSEFLRFVLSPEGAHWCGPQGCEAMAAAALERAVTLLVARFGPDPASWRWGEAHVARFEHPLLRFIPGIAPLIRLSSATPGDPETVSRGGMRSDFAHVHGAGLRLVADLGSPDGLYAIIGTGQSGHPASAHWGDQHPLWTEGRMLRLAARAGNVAGRIELRP
jgi:penicillin G amidase